MKESFKLMSTISQRSLSLGGIVLGAAAVLGLITGCGSTANAAAVAATPTCPATATLATATGSVTAVSATGLTVQTATGSVMVTFTSNTRYTKSVPVDPVTLTSGTTVQVVVSKGTVTSTVIPAQSIIVQTATTAGFGAGNGTPRAGNGTPRAGNGGGFNAACRGRGAAAQNGFRGVRGTITAINTGSHQITVTDAKNASYVFSVDTTTTVATTARGTQADVAVGDTINASGQQNTNGIQAITIQDVKASGK